jgi:spore coat-associated protein N
VTSHSAGPVVLDEELPRAASLVPGGVEHLLATVPLPESAGNEFMGAETGLSVLFTGTQRGGTTR